MGEHYEAGYRDGRDGQKSNGVNVTVSGNPAQIQEYLLGYVEGLISGGAQGGKCRAIMHYLHSNCPICKAEE